MISRRLFDKRLKNLEKSKADNGWRLADGENQFINDVTEAEKADLLSGPGPRRDAALQKRGVPAEALPYLVVRKALFANDPSLRLEETGELPSHLLSSYQPCQVFHFGDGKLYF